MYRRLGARTRLSLEVANQIKTLIRQAKLKPGDKLPNETDLGGLFGVSRPTVREAVKSLASQNIIEIRRGRGTFVTQNPGISSDPLGLDFLPHPDLPASLIEVRQIIEPEVAGLAAQRADASELQALAAMVREMESITDQHEAWTQREVAFHRAIAEATGNPVIMRMVPVILDAIVNTLQYAPRTAADHRQALVEHRSILRGLQERDSQAAAEAVRQHLRNSYRRTLSIGAAGQGHVTQPLRARPRRRRRSSE